MAFINKYNLTNNHNKRYNEIKHESETYKTYEIIYNDKRNKLIAHNKMTKQYMYFSYGYFICSVEFKIGEFNPSIHLNKSLWDYSRTTKMGLYKLFNDLFNVDIRQSDIIKMIENNGINLNGDFYKLYLFSDIEY